MNKLSTKNYVLVLTDNSRFFLDEKEAEMVKQALRENTKFIEIGENIINTFHVSRIVVGSDYEESEKFKKGDYKCKECNEWIPKGKSCGKCW